MYIIVCSFERVPYLERTSGSKVTIIFTLLRLCLAEVDGKHSRCPNSGGVVDKEVVRLSERACSSIGGVAPLYLAKTMRQVW